MFRPGLKALKELEIKSPLAESDFSKTDVRKLAEEYGVAYLTSDFKKKNGYKRSVELSAQYGLYRQDYCGCEFSMRQRLEEQQARKEQ